LFVVRAHACSPRLAGIGRLLVSAALRDGFYSSNYE
jgi:hypothetical protein